MCSNAVNSLVIFHKIGKIRIRREKIEVFYPCSSILYVIKMYSNLFFQSMANAIISCINKPDTKRYVQLGNLATKSN
jgi:hypothetical protein